MTVGEPNLELAAYYISAERPRQALEVLRHADPEDVRTYALRGQAFLQLQQFAAAERELRRGLELDPDHVVMLMLLAQAETSSDAFAAEVTLRKALVLDPENAMLYATYVAILMEQGRYEWAERMLERGMQIAPEAMEQTRALFLLQASGSAEALQAAHEMLRSTPDDAAAHYLQGLALLRRGHVQRGLRHLREAAALRPADPVFSAAARTLGAWYLWPVHLTTGVRHRILSAAFIVAGLAAIGLTEDLHAFWPVIVPWLAFTACKWVAVGISTAMLKLRIARATRDAMS